MVLRPRLELEATLPPDPRQVSAWIGRGRPLEGVSTHAADTTSSKTNLRALLTDRFSSIRHHVTGADAKRAAADYFINTMEEYGMQIFMDGFLLSDRRIQAANILALWNGRQSNTPNDKPVLLAAHYDTTRDSPGVDKNGSGMAALIEAARVISSQPCLQEYTVGFVAFDFWEREKRKSSPQSACYEWGCGSRRRPAMSGAVAADRKSPQSACYEWGCGSRQWVTYSLMPYLEQSGLTPANFQGVIVMDTIMNYNNTPGSQAVPNAEIYKQTPGVVDIYRSSEADGFRGNFITSVARSDYDRTLYTAFQRKWNSLGDPQYKQYNALIPIKDVETDGPKSPYWPVYRFLSYSDLWSFWKDNPDLKTMLLSDTAPLRGQMQQCFHQPCDDMRFVTEENLGLLKKTTDAVIALALEFSNTRTSCRDPLTAAPANFKAGLTMEGALEIDGQDLAFKIVVDAFKPSGVVRMTVGNEDLSVSDSLSGRYDAETQQLTMRLTEPIQAVRVEEDPFKKTNWNMNGQELLRKVDPLLPCPVFSG
ncbi:Hypp3366 [Branchiostoma lanceolatum]|uniref:Hypp3366 protein n=1 Tax=Branchiostoma lanceolatum TaxID=7740 RepID=A0A8J9ZZI0_BRALA|nr:Hypp3366 [Branchiostoma lanceolatum]